MSVDVRLDAVVEHNRGTLGAKSADMQRREKTRVGPLNQQLTVQASPFIRGPVRLQRDTLGVDDVWWYIRVARAFTLTRRFREQVNALKIIW